MASFSKNDGLIKTNAVRVSDAEDLDEVLNNNWLDEIMEEIRIENEYQLDDLDDVVQMQRAAMIKEEDEKSKFIEFTEAEVAEAKEQDKKI